MKQQTCKYIAEDSTKCLSLFHTKMYHNPPKPIKRTPIKKPDHIAEVRNMVSKSHIVAGHKMEITKVKKPSKKKTKSRSYYVKKLDSVFSQYIRQTYAIDGLTACVTCGVIKPWQEQQNGHYESRGNLPTRWSEDNCHPQCVACNVFKKGNYTEYALWMIDTYGADKLVGLKARANSKEKIPTLVIKEKIEYYKGLLK